MTISFGEQLRRRSSRPHTLACGLIYLGLVKMQLLHEQGFTLGMTTALEVLAAQAGLRGRHAEAAQLVGAAQAQRSATANTATTIHHADYNRLFDMARGRPGPDDRAGARAGRASEHRRLVQLG